MSETVPLVYSVIAQVAADLSRTGVGKDAQNEHDRYRYRSIDAVLAALAPLLARHGLVILPTITARDVIERSSKSGGLLLHTVIAVRFRFVAAADGSSVDVEVFGESTDRADKGLGKALTAAYKLAVTEVFCIAYAGSDDADAVTEEARGNARTRRGSSAGSTRSDGALMVNVDEAVANWSDQIDAAGTVAELHAVADLLKLAPSAVRLDRALRSRFADRLDALRAVEADRAELDGVTT